MGPAARILGIALVAVAAGCSLSREPPTGVREPTIAPVDPLYARRGAERFPIEDGPPIAGPSRDALMRVREPVPVPEPPSAYGNPPAYIVDGRVYRTRPSSRGYVEKGIASWYGRKFHGRLTSTREPYDMFAMTAAHRSLPLPTFVRVTHLENGRSAVVRVNDRGPFHPGRIIDLSYTAAVKLGIVDPGSAAVEVRAIEFGADGRSVPPPRAAAVQFSLHYFVQVGAYSNEHNATRALAVAERLRPGLASLEPIEREERVLHRVRIGPFSRPDETDRVLDGLNAVGVRNARVVIESRAGEASGDDNA